MREVKLLASEGKTFRLDKYLTNKLSSLSRTQIKEMILSGQVLVNGNVSKPSTILTGQETILYSLPEPEEISSLPKPQPITLDIVYEDDCIVAVNKPAGLIVHPGAGNPDGTLVNGLAYHFNSLSDINGASRPGIIHRLDKETSGIILIAKTNLAHSKIAEQFEKRTVKKTYEGITWGTWSESAGIINEPIQRKRSDPRMYIINSGGREAITQYKVIHQDQHLSHMEFYPKTGRTHQIRVHASGMNHPIFADEKYSGGLARTKGFIPEVSRNLKQLYQMIGRHALHAKQIQFQHPASGKAITLDAPLPDEFLSLIKAINSSDA